MCCFVQYACVSFTVKALAVARWGYTQATAFIYFMLHEVTFWLCFGCIMVTLWLLLQLLFPPGWRLCCAIPRREWTCLQFLLFLESPCSLLAASSLPILGFSKQCTQCEQQDSWCHQARISSASGIVSRMRSNTMIDIKPQAKLEITVWSITHNQYIDMSYSNCRKNQRKRKL